MAINLKIVSTLNEDYDFYQYLDDQARPLLGQFFAVKRGSSRPSTNNTQVVDAVVKKTDRPNPEVMGGLLNSAFIHRQKRITGKNPAAAVAVWHPNLVVFLLSTQATKSATGVTRQAS